MDGVERRPIRRKGGEVNVVGIIKAVLRLTRSAYMALCHGESECVNVGNHMSSLFL